MGVTRPHRVTLTDGSRTVRAIWKTISEYSAKMDFHDGLPPEIGFRDSYKSEVAAYELDKLLGFDFVPPTVMRRVRRTKGSIQWWIEDCITEAERRKQGLKPTDAAEWAKQIYDARLFHQLIHDSDYQNINNLLVDKNFRVWVIDHSRAFRTHPRLLNQEYLRRFSREHLERLRHLTPELLEEKLDAWLTPKQRQSLLARRDLILQHAEQLIAERGEDKVLF